MDVSNLNIGFQTGRHTFLITLPFNFHVNKLEGHRSATPYKHEHAKYEVICIRYHEPQQQDEFIVIPPLTPHFTYQASSRNCAFVTSFQFSMRENSFSRQDETRCFHSADLSIFSRLKEPVTVKDTFSGRDLLLQIQREAAIRGPSCCDMLNALFFLLLVHISRSIASEVLDDRSPSTRSLDERRLDIIDLFFWDNYSDPACRCSQLARMLCISERHLLRILKDNYGKSFRELLLQTRMEIAEAHRKLGPITAAQLAERIGYSGTGSFLGAYRKYFVHSFRETGNCRE